MLFKVIFGVYCKKHKKRSNTLCGFQLVLCTITNGFSIVIRVVLFFVLFCYLCYSLLFVLFFVTCVVLLLFVLFYLLSLCKCVL